MTDNPVQVFTEDINFKYSNYSFLNPWISAVLLKEDKTMGFVNIIFCSDDYLLRLNKDHLNHDYYTDILTFQYEESPIEGDLYISIDRVKENAKEQKEDFSIELHRVIIHGILHLLGYDDKEGEDQILMSKKEDEYLQLLEEIPSSC